MAIYGAFDGSGVCLYVGETHLEHPALRWAEHVRRGSPWVMEAVRWEVLADLTERAASKRLNPTCGDPTKTHTKIRGPLVGDAERAAFEGLQLIPDP